MIRIIDQTEIIRRKQDESRRNNSRYRPAQHRLVKDAPPIAPFQHMAPEAHFLVDIDRLYRRQSLQVFDFIASATGRDRREDNMAVRLLDFDKRQMPRSKVGKFATLEDVAEAMRMLKDLPAGKAVEIVVEDADCRRLKADGTEDPARSIVSMLRRKFVAGGLPYKCYASDDKTITIVKAPAGKGGGKK